MGKRSDRRIFRRRRRRVGVVLFVSIAVVVLGGFIFFRTDPAATANEGPIAGVELPTVAASPAQAPDQEAIAAAEKEKAKELKAERQAERQAELRATRQEAREKREAEARAIAENPPDPPTDDLWMSIPALGLYDNYVTNTSDQAAMDYGAIKLPETGFPWQENANTYIAAHRLGWPGTGSHRQFYNLPLLGVGDVIYLGDANGTTYTYKVSGFKEVAANDTSVTAPQTGRDMLSLQTCIENYGDYWTMGPNWYVRYIVQADRVSVDPA
jgi:sortase A